MISAACQAMHALPPSLHHCWQIGSLSKPLSEVQTGDNPNRSRYGLYAGCLRISSLNCWIVAVVWSVWGWALLWSKRIPCDSLPQCWFQIVLTMSLYLALLTMVPPFLIMLKDWTEEIPEDSEHNFASWWLRSEFLWRRRWWIFPLHANWHQLYPATHGFVVYMVTDDWQYS